MQITINRHRFTDPVPIVPGMQDWVGEAAERAGFAWERVPSGAGHDAQAIATIAPMAMVFVPSVERHQPRHARSTPRPEDCANGVASPAGAPAAGRRAVVAHQNSIATGSRTVTRTIGKVPSNPFMVSLSNHREPEKASCRQAQDE